MSWNDWIEQAVCIMLLLFNKACVVPHLAMRPSCCSSRWWVTGPKPPDLHSGTPWSSLWYQNKRRKQWHRTLPVPKGMCDTGHLKKQAKREFHWSCSGRAGLSLPSTSHPRSGQQWDWASCCSRVQLSGFSCVLYGLGAGSALTSQYLPLWRIWFSDEVG